LLIDPFSLFTHTLSAFSSGYPCRWKASAPEELSGCLSLVKLYSRQGSIKYLLAVAINWQSTAG